MRGNMYRVQFLREIVKNRLLTAEKRGRIVETMKEIPDAPEIRRMERLGMMRAEREPRCPVCGAVCEWLYLYRGYDPVGCDRCVERADARERGEENGTDDG